MPKRGSQVVPVDKHVDSPPDEPQNVIKLPTMFVVRVTLERYLRTERQWLRDFLGEFIGTTLLVTIICGNAAQHVLSKGKAGTRFFPISFANGMAITFGVYLSGNTSGGHINPAVTMVMVLVGRTTWRMLPVYWLAQYLGGFIGAAVVHLTYYDALNHHDGGIRRISGPNATAGIFGVAPQEFLSLGYGWLDQVIGTAVLTMCIFAVHDERNVEIPKYLLPLVIGMVVNMIGMTYGWNCGFPINPARDLGPRIYTAVAGWGKNVFRYRGYRWFWVTWMGPHVGALLGTIIYMLFVGIHWPMTFDRNYQTIRKASITSTIMPTIPMGSLGASRKVSFAADIAARQSPHKQSIVDIPEIRVEEDISMPPTYEQLKPKPKYKEFQFDKEIKIIVPVIEEDENGSNESNENSTDGDARNKY